MSMDYSFDLVIYGIFTLLVTTANFWRGTWKTLQRRERRQGAVKVLLLSWGVHLLRELLIIKVCPRPSPSLAIIFCCCRGYPLLHPFLTSRLFVRELSCFSPLLRQETRNRDRAIDSGANKRKRYMVLGEGYLIVLLSALFSCPISGLDRTWYWDGWLAGSGIAGWCCLETKLRCCWLGVAH